MPILHHTLGVDEEGHRQPWHTDAPLQRLVLIHEVWVGPLRFTGELQSQFRLRIVEVHADEGDVVVALMCALEDGRLGPARWAPLRPEVHDHGLARQPREIDALVRSQTRQVGRGEASGHLLRVGVGLRTFGQPVLDALGFQRNLPRGW